MVGDYRADGGPLAATPALTTEKGDRAFDASMKERRFEDRPVKPLGRFRTRPEPIVPAGGGSVLTAVGGGSGGPRRASRGMP